MKYAFAKMHGAGNDFVLIEDPDCQFPLEPGVIRKLCSMHEGLGTEGLLLLRPPRAEGIVFTMLFFNPDGSRASMCGNGSRCAAYFAYQCGLAPRRQVFGTDAGPVEAELVAIGKAEAQVRIRMTPPGDRRHDLSVGACGFLYQYLDTGVPHEVTFVPDVDAVDVETEGRSVSYAESFAPAGTNVDFAQVTGPSSLRVRTYERGVEAETAACGTGCAASAAAAVESGRCTSPVRVLTAFGAELEFVCEPGADGLTANLLMTGPARIICRGELEADWLVG